MNNWPQINPELVKALVTERNEWQQRAEMVWRQRDAADRRADRLQGRAEAVEKLLEINERKLRDILALCVTAVDGESRSHVPVADVLAILRGEGDRPAERPHEFTEDVADVSMCICGIPAYPHHPIHGGEGDRG